MQTGGWTAWVPRRSPALRRWRQGKGQKQHRALSRVPSFLHGRIWWCWRTFLDSRAWTGWPTDPHGWRYQKPLWDPQTICRGSGFARGTSPVFGVPRRSCLLFPCYAGSRIGSRRLHRPASTEWCGSGWHGPWSSLLRSRERCHGGCRMMPCHLCSCTGGWCWHPWSPAEPNSPPRTAATAHLAWLGRHLLLPCRSQGVSRQDPELSPPGAA